MVDRRAAQGGSNTNLLFWFIMAVVVAVLLGCAWFGFVTGSAIAGVNAAEIAAGPAKVIGGLVRHTVVWPVPATVMIAVYLAVAIAVAIVVPAMVSRARKGRGSRVDSAARLMGTGRDIEALTRKHAASEAARFGVEGSPGLPLGVTVAGGVPLASSWENVMLLLAGPRAAKTTCYVIPQILEAPGACVATSNKRDLVDATRDVRAQLGAVWVFDPQQIAEEPADWYWNPLSYVTDEVQAAQLAQHFASGSRDPGAKTDAYFDPAGQDLLAGLLLAAAMDNRPITDVYTWLTQPTNNEPVRILRDAGFPLTSQQVAGVIAAPDKQRGGIYGTAQQMAACLTNRKIAEWIIPSPGRREFHPELFVRSTDTLYSLSREGRGSAGPIITALTVAIVEAAEGLAARSPRGRLTVPLVLVLDEAANVCRWKDLPDLYSHYGSKGIIVVTVLQSWSQGVDVWGQSGMNKLWSAANVKAYAGSIYERDFLETLSMLIGDFDRVSHSVSSSRGGGSRSTNFQRERILTVDELSALPKGRAVILGSGSRATLARTVPWMRGPHAAAVEASIRAHDPQSARTLEDARGELSEIEAPATFVDEKVAA